MALSQPQLVHVDDRVLKDRAHALIQEGKLEAAADLYVQLIAQNNKDPSLRLHHAELCEKLHRKDRAVAAYQIAAHLLAAAGHAARARAALNVGLRIAPRDPGLLRALRELCPPPQLALVPTLSLVPKPASFEDLDLDDEVPADEANTEPHLIAAEEWEEVVLSQSGGPKHNQTVRQRTPLRPQTRPW